MSQSHAQGGQYTRSSRRISRQQRAGRFAGRRATESFNEQFRQFDRGHCKFQQSIEISTEDIIDYVNNENNKRTRRGSGRGLQVAAHELARRELGAVAAIHREVTELSKTGKYGHAPREKPNDTFRLMYENWNSLGVFTGDRKIRQINKLATDYEVDTIAGCESQCDWRFA